MNDKSSLKMVVKSRIESAKAKEQRQNSIKAIYSDRPLDAEYNEGRKINRFQAVADVDVEQAKKIAHYEKDSLKNLQGERRIGAESIQGKTIDFLSVSFLDLAKAASGTVGRVLTEDYNPIGSGFMISDRLFLTNNHVIPDVISAKNYFVEFNYELDYNNKPKQITRFPFSPEEFFVTDPEYELDFTVIAIGERDIGNNNANLNLSDIGYSPLLDTDDKHVLGELVNIIQHPEGDYKQITLRENQLITRLDQVLHYVADTNPGSSGSPVYNDQWEVIAVHHWGEPTVLETPDGKKLRRDVNEGVRISKIIELLKSKRNSLELSQQTLLDELLNPKFRYPSILNKKQKIVLPESYPEVKNTIPPDAKNISDRIGTLNIPLEISIRLGNVSIADIEANIKAIDVFKKDFESREAIRIDRNYSNRSGYNPNFLPNYPIYLPILNDMQKLRAAKKINTDNEDEYELKYEHFSLVINAKRRMAFFTAVNIDGSTWTDIDRDTGEPREAEAFESWFIDPRILPIAQSDQSLYSNQQPRRIFDRGHLVRRQDPCWGNDELAKRANADTFHFTNCSTQESTFNQRTEYWQGIEKYVLDNAKAEDEKVSVFTGPVFDEDDPDYRYTKVPLQFWKILVRVENGNLLATAMLADQSQRISGLPEKLSEGFDDMSGIQEYQTSVHDIELITGLDFGPLRDHDTFQAGPEAVPARKVKLASYKDIQL